jgi:hypothetical protein
MHPRLPAITLLLLTATTLLAAPPDIRLEPTDNSLKVFIGDALFTEYRTHDAQRPYLYPITAPSGANLARPYPMEEGGAKDHPHHRSLWFTHGSVNGIDYWADGPKHGVQKHHEFYDIKPGKGTASFRTRTHWQRPSGDHTLTDERLITIHATEEQRSIDFTVTLIADTQDILFGDTKEGSFALRVCPSLTPEEKDSRAHILSSTGKKDAAVWGQQAPWVCYHGPDPLGTDTLVTLFDHPKNLRHPTWWHARTYGLFAANPFGQHDFEKLEDKTAGDFTLKKGERLTLSYRVHIQHGQLDPTLLQDEFQRFSQTTP